MGDFVGKKAYLLGTRWILPYIQLANLDADRVNNCNYSVHIFLVKGKSQNNFAGEKYIGMPVRN